MGWRRFRRRNTCPLDTAPRKARGLTYDRVIENAMREVCIPLGFAYTRRSPFAALAFPEEEFPKTKEEALPELLMWAREHRP